VSALYKGLNIAVSPQQMSNLNVAKAEATTDRRRQKNKDGTHEKTKTVKIQMPRRDLWALSQEESSEPTQHLIQWVPGGPFPGGEARLGRDTDHSSPSSAKVKNE
jgi:hypothetical protein